MAARTVFIDSALSNYQSVATQYDAAVFNVVLLNSASPHAEQIQSWMKSNGVNAADINIVSASTSVNGAFTPRVVFVDASIADLGTVIAGVPANATVVVLDAGRDGVQQIHDYLAANGGTVGAIDIVTDLASVDVVSHGAPGQVMLGSTVLNADTLAQYSSQLAEIGSHLTAGADLLLYGCDIASGATGQQFITALAAATGADVAASTDLTGSAAAGGDWNLEANTGTIETAALNIAGYDALLAQTISNIKILPDTGDSGSDFITSATTLTVTFTVTGDNSAIWVTIDGGTRKQATLVAGSKDNYTVTLNPVTTNGTHAIQFWDKQTTGSTPFATKSYTLDTTPPDAGKLSFFDLTRSGGDNGPTNDRNFSLSLSGNESGTTVKLEVSKNGGSYSDTTATQTDLTDGSYQFRATVTDAAGNAATSVASITIDGTAPAAGALNFDNLDRSGGTNGPTNDRNFSLALTGNEAGSTVKLEVSKDGASYTDTTATQTNLADGSYQFRATVTDAAGNEATSMASITIDGTAPAAGILGFSNLDRSGGDNGPTNDRNFSLALTGNEAGSTVKLEVSKDGASYTDTTATQTNLADGSYQFRATVTDAAGNAATSVASITIDGTAPAAGTLSFDNLDRSGGTNGPTNDRNFSLALTGNEAGSTVKLQVSKDGASYTDTTATQTNLADGSYQFRATVTDAAGNAATSVASITIDGTAPAAGTLSFDNLDRSGGANGPTNDRDFTLALTGNEAGSTVKLQVSKDGASYTDTTATQTNLADGSYQFRATVTDAAGNAATSVASITIDGTAPAAGTLSFDNLDRSGGANGPTNDRDFTLAVSGNEAGSTVAYEVSKDNGKTFQSTTATQANLADGSYQFHAIVTDAAGNSATTGMVSVPIDGTAPTATASLANDTGASGTDGTTSDATLTLSPLEQDATRTYSVDGKAATSNYNPNDLGEGQHTVEVIDTDLAGNIGKSSVVSFVLDKTAPVVTASLASDTGASGTDGTTSDATLTLSALEQDATRIYSVDGKAAASSYDPTSLAEGQHTVQVIDTDLAGNVGKSSVATFVLDKTAPIVTASLANDTGSNKTDGTTSDANLALSALEKDATRSYSVDGKAATSSYDPTSLEEGQHTVQVIDTDLAGNVGKSSVVTFVLDKTAPTVTASLANDTGSNKTDGTTSDATLVLSALEKDATRTYSIDGKAATSYDPTSLTEGQHTVQVIDTDLAGNVGNSALVTFVLDKTAPTVTASLAGDTGASGTDGTTSDATLTLSALEKDATRTYSIDGKAATSSYDPTSLTEGQHTVQVIDSDLAGNVGKSSVVSFLLDKTAPVVTASLASDTGASGTDGTTSDATLTLSALEKDATRNYSIDGKAATSSYDPASLTEGQHTVEVIDTDLAGNVGNSALVTFVLDKTAPTVTASLANDTGSNKTDGTTSDATLTLSALEQDATRTYSIDGKAAASSYDPTSLAEGQHTIQVIDTDLAGNVGKSSVVTFVLDKTAPTVTASLANDTGSNKTDGTTSDATLALSALEKDATRTYSIDGKAAASSYDPASLTEGQHTVQVIDTDLAGNVGNSALVTFVLDKTAPTVTASLANDTGSNKTDGTTSDATLTVNALEKDATRSYSVDGKAATSNYNPNDLGEGQHTVEVIDTDLAGNIGKSSVVSFVLDKTAPTVTASLANDTGSNKTDGTTSDATLTVSALEQDATRSYSVDGKAATSNYNPNDLGEGQHTVEVIDTDLAGNIGKSSVVSFVLDKTAPVVTASLASDTGASGTDGTTSDATLALSALEKDATRNYSIDGKAATSSYDPASLTEGQHTVEVIDTDLAGNVGNSALVTFVLDKTAPTVTASLAGDTGASGTDGTTSDATLALSALEQDATRTYSIDGKAATSSYDPASLTEGRHTVQVIDTDLAGNVGKSSVVSFVLDKTAPVVTASLASDTGASGTDGTTSDATLTLSALEQDATRTYSVDGKAATSSYDPTSLAEGQHTVQVIDTDLAGNTGKSTVVSFVLDKTAPTVTASLAGDTGASGTDGTTSDATLTLSALEKDATRTYSIDGKAATSSYDPTSLTEGQHTVQVIDSDLAGNVGKSSVVSFLLDKTAPVVTASLASDTGASGTDGTTSDATLTLSALEKDATRTYSIDGKAATSSYDPTSLTEGQHTVQVIDSDLAGNVGKSSVVSFVLDKTAPVVTASLASDTGASGTDGTTSDATLALSALEKDATRNYSIDGKAATSSYDPASLTEGQHTVEVIDTDLAGNVGNSAPVTFVLDKTAPVVTASLASDTGSNKTDGTTSDATLTLSALEQDATRTYSIDGKAAASSYDPTSLEEGQHTVQVIDTDLAGNVGKSSVVTFVLDKTAPTVTASLANDTGSNKTDGTTSDATLALSALEKDATRTYSIDGKAATSSYDPASLTEGQHTVQVIDTDLAGNVGNSALVTFVLDKTAPTVTASLANDTGSNQTDGTTSDATLTVNALEKDATRSYSVDGKAATSNYNPNDLGEGQHTVEVIDTDLAGNIGKSSVVSFVLDKTAPVVTASLASDTGASGTDGTTSDATLTLSALEQDATRIYSVDGKAAASSYDPTSLAEGQHTVQVIDTDLAGNVGKSSVATFVLDKTAPIVTASLANDTGSNKTDGTTSDANLALSALEKDATRSYSVDGKAATASYEPTSMADGHHTVEVTDTDVAGNSKTVKTEFTLDTALTAPTAKLTLDSGTAGDDLTSNAGLTFNTADTDATRVIKVDGTVVGSYDASKLADGKHTVIVTDTDGAGNTASVTANFELDSKGPVFSSAGSATAAENIGENKLVYKALAADAHGVSFSLAGADAAKFDIAADGAVTLKENPNYEAVNAYAFTVVATDNAGNHTDQAVALAITNVNEAPVATSISKSTIENAQLSFQVADYISDPDIGDRLGVSLGTATATLSWMNTDPAAPKTIINPVTKAVVDLSTLSVKASLSADGSTVTLTPPTELDWLATGQAVKASFSYTVTDAAGSTSQEKIDFVMNGSTNDKGVNLSGGNGDDNLAGNATNNAEDVLNGGNGNDTLSGFGGTDALYGGNGDDKLSGGVGIDYLYGDSGNDTIDGGLDGDYIFGGKGNDVLTGGGGADKFVFAPQGGSDRITDFRLADGDKLFFADFFSTAITVDAFLQKYVTDTGNDLLINLQGTQIVVVGVANVSDLAGAISFGVPA